MEFKTTIPFVSADSGFGASVYVLIAFAMWILVCGSQDALVVTWLRAVLAAAIRCLRAVLAAITPAGMRRPAVVNSAG